MMRHWTLFVVTGLALGLAIQSRSRDLLRPVFEFHALADLLDATDSQATPPDVIWFGDSVLRQRAATDKDTRNIVKMTQDRLAGVTILTLAFPTWAADTFERFVRRIVSRPRRPRLLVVEINLRSFADVWVRNPRFDLSDQRLLLDWFDSPAFLARKALHSFQYDLPPIGWPEFLAVPVTLDGQRIGSMADYVGRTQVKPSLPTALDPSAPRDTRAASPTTSVKGAVDPGRIVYAAQYGAVIADQHPRKIALHHIVQASAQAGIPVLAYVTPVNHERLGQHCGIRALEVTRVNRRSLESIFVGASPGRGVTPRWIDLADALPDSRFIDSLEHLDQEGRSTVASRIATSTRLLLDANSKQ